MEQELETTTSEPPAVELPAQIDEPTADENLWDDMIGEPEAPSESVPAEATPPVETPKVEEPKAPVPPPAVEPQAPPLPSKAQEPVAPMPGAAPVDYAALRAAELERLEVAYAIPADQATALLTEPEVVFPKLAAKLHQDIMANVLAVMQAHLPQAIEAVTSSRSRESEAKQEFYSTWPELQGYEQQVLAAGAMFRQINPSAPKEKAIEAIGMLAMQALGLQRAAPAAAPPPATGGFRPAGVAPAPRASAPKDPFTQALNEFISEDF